MRDEGRWSVLGVDIAAVDYDAAVAAVVDAAHRRVHLGVSALAVHGVMTGADDPEHRYRLNALDLAVPDGQPVRWALKILHGISLDDRVYGPELTLRVCAAAAEEALPVFFYGSEPAVLDALVGNLRARHPELRVAGSRPSMFRPARSDEEQAEIAADIVDSGAAICFVGLGCPRQEVFVYEHRHLLPMPVLAVGAAFDFHAGTLRQAPPTMQALGLEWLYRLIREPRRLWRRYLTLNPRYVLALSRQRAGRLRVGPAVPPAVRQRPA